MIGNLLDSRWLVPCGGQGSSFVVRGWHPAPVEWSLAALHHQQKALRRLKIIFALRPDQRSGSQPEVLFDRLPVPLFAADNYVIETFNPFWDGFTLALVQTGFIADNGFEKWGRSLLPAPTPEVMFADPADVPLHRHMAVIANRFCVSTELLEQASYYFRNVVCSPLGESAVIPLPTTPDFSGAFNSRVPAREPVVEEKIFSFIIDSLQRYQAQCHTPIYGMLLDCDPQYGYVILALKQFPLADASPVDIDDFELDQFAILEARELYGDATYLPPARMRAVLRRVIERLPQHDAVQASAGIPTLQIAYAFHDEEIHWLARV